MNIRGQYSKRLLHSTTSPNNVMMAMLLDFTNNYVNTDVNLM